MRLELHCWILELIGSFMLTFVALTQDPKYIGGLSSLLCLSFLTWGGKEISGAHFNPVVSIAMIVSRQKDPINGLFYIAFQFLGAFLAALLQYMTSKLESNSNWDQFIPTLEGIPSNLYQPALAESVSTFFFVFAYMALMVDKTASKGIYGFGVGAAYALGILSIAGFTGGCLNPFKWIAPTLLNFKNLSYGAVYVLGPLIGGILGSTLYQVIFLNRKQVKIN